MLNKISIILTLICCVCVLPSYTNCCAKPDAAFRKAVQLKCTEPVMPASIVNSVPKKSNRLEVFPLDLISIQL